MLSALAVTMDLNVAEAPDAGITIGLYQQIYKLVMILVTDIEKRGFLLSLLALLFWGAYWYIWKKMRIEIIKYSKGLSLFLALMYTAGVGYAYQNTVTVLFQSSIRLGKMVIMVTGFFMIFLTGMNLLYLTFRSDSDIQLRKIAIFEKKTIFELFFADLWYLVDSSSASIYII